MFDINVWIGAVLVGMSLGLLGAGGSVLTVPLLVYLAKEPEKLAVAESLLIVGVVALIGSITHLKKRTVSIYHAFAFGLPSMIFASLGAYISRFFDGQTQLVAFAIILLLASGFMLRPINTPTSREYRQPKSAILILTGAAVGVIAGFVGVGGGFLIVPALLAFAFMSVKKAIATSLVIIVMQSIAGFSTYAIHFVNLDLKFNWPLIGLVTGCAVLGVLVGNKLNQKLPQKLLKRIFGLFLIPISIFVLSNNI